MEDCLKVSTVINKFYIYFNPVGSTVWTIGAEFKAELDPDSRCQLLPFAAPQLGTDYLWIGDHVRLVVTDHVISLVEVNQAILAWSF